jgi:hypothetical protein
MMRSTILGIVLALAPAGLHGATIAGQTIRPGERINIEFPLAKEVQAIAARGGNPAVTTGRATLVFPAGFDPAKPWPVLIVTSTSDFNRTSPMDVGFYRPAATAEGWVVLASDGPVRMKSDSAEWRLAMLLGALDALHREWPQSRNWPVAMAGYSGGAKRTGDLAPYLVKAGLIRLCGLFLTGINVDRLSESYRKYAPGAGFLDTRIYLSSGALDKMATPADHNQVLDSLRRTGFHNVRIESFPGEHEVNAAAVRDALHWFRPR